MSDYSFGKRHKLCGKILIDKLFTEGSVFYSYPVKCVWLLTDRRKEDDKESIRLLFSVSKRNHKRAVRRNLLKRRMREAYRLNRFRWGDVSIPEDKILLIALIYGTKEAEGYEKIQSGILKAIRTIKKEYENRSDFSVYPID